MRITIAPLILSLLLLTCQSNDDASEVDLIGSWLLIEQYADPGDGSGDFVPVDSDRVITFSADGTITSNGNLCNMTITSDEDSTGTFNTEENSITPDNCFSSEHVLAYELANNRLLVFYPCIEACEQKFRKIN